MPYSKMPRSYEKYPTRKQVVEYLEHYANKVGQEVRFGETVGRVVRNGSGWAVDSTSGRLQASHVVMATGYTCVPNRPVWPDMEDYRGEVLHSSEYRNGLPYENKNVVVVGFGNSACEIAICLHEHGASPTMSVRDAVNVIPRDVFGIPVLSFGILQRYLPASVADALNAPLIRLLVGDITKLGLRKLPYGASTQIREKGKVPVLDIGTLDLIKNGDILVRPGIERFLPDGVRFSDGSEESFDAVILGTGYRPNLHEIVQDVPGGGLHFCGFNVSPSGMLREIGIEARRIAKTISANRRHSG